MSLRIQTLVIIGVTIIGLIVILLGVSQVILLNSFANLEQQHAVQGVERVLDALSDDLAKLDSTAGDWATWDDTYAFVGGSYDGYVKDNLMDTAFVTLGLNLMLFTDSSGQFVFGKAFDLQSEEEVPVPESLREYLASDSPLIRHLDKESSVTGFLLLPEGPMLIASHPIVTSAGEGPVRGTLVTGYYMNSEEIQGLAQKTHLSLVVHRLDDPRMPADFQAARPALSSESPILVRPLSTYSVAGYTLLNDAFGKPALVLRVDMPRDIYAQGQASISYFALSLSIIGLAFGGVTVLLLERRILSRLAHLHAGVSRIGESGDLSARVAMAGRDELSKLAGTINWMLEALEQSQASTERSLSLLRATLESTADGILVVDNDGKMSAYNQKFVDLWRIPDSIIKTRDDNQALAFVLDELIDPEAFLTKVRELYNQADAESYDLLELKDGRVFERYSQPQRIAGKSVGRLWSFREITEQVHAQAKLQRLKEFNEDIIQNMREGIVVEDTDGYFTFVNPAAASLLGYMPEELEGQHWTVVVPPDQHSVVLVANERRARGESDQYELELLCKEGSRLAVLVSSTPRFEDGRFVGTLAVFTDITKLMQAEKALAEEHNLLRTLIDNVPDFIFVKDLESRFVINNRAHLHVLGATTQQEVVGKTDFDIFPQNLAAQYYADEQAIVQSGQPLVSREEPFLDPAGEERWLSTTKVLLRDGQGQVEGVVGISRDITGHKRAEQEICKLNQYLGSIIENANIWLNVLDEKGNVVIWNKAAEELSGYSREEVLGHARIWEWLYPDEAYRNEVFAQAVAIIEEGKEEQDSDTTIRCKDGRTRIISWSSRSLMDERGAPIGSIALGRDITERKQAQEALILAKEAAEAAARAKSEFLANMSHEIRTPMNAVVGMTEMLLDTSLTSKQREYAEIIRKSGDALLTIINDILDFSKIESGKLDLEKQPFELRDCLEEALDLLASRAAEKGLEMAYIMNDRTPETLVGDSIRLRQILVNLLGNAVKFTESGEVVVSVTSRRLGEKLNEVHFAVKDTGVGIPPERTDRLFRSFSQLDSSTTRKYGGTGLGLAISKHLAEMMGGTIWVESKGIPGQGSTFHFTILAEVASSQERAYLHSPQPHIAGKRLLIVDDSATNRHILVQQTQKWGMLPCDVATGSEALEWIRRGDPLDVAILDMQMPEMDGLTLAAEIRKCRDARSLPLVMLSSMGRLGEIPQNNEGDFVAWLTKPIKSSQLYEILAGIFARQAVPVVEPATQSQIVLQADGRHLLRILLAEDNPINQKVALSLLEKVGYRADVATNGCEVLDALEQRLYDVVLMDVHMPEMDGLEATQLIREQWAVERQPRIIAMTASAMQEDRERCFEVGMDDYVSKPVRAEDLLRVLDRCQPLSFSADLPSDPLNGTLQEARGTAIAETTIAATTAPLTMEAIDTAVLDDLQARMGEVIPELIGIYFENASKLLVNMRQAIAQRDSQALFRAAHTLKPGSATLGAISLATLCEELEAIGRNGIWEDAPEKTRQAEAEYERVKSALEAIRSGRNEGENTNCR